MAGTVSAAAAAAKWKRVVATRGPDYELGIKNPRRPWMEATLEAADRYATGITQALADNRFQKGVSRAGTAKWSAMALAKGPSRWTQGVAVAESAYEKGFRPFADALNAITLTPRQEKGNPANIIRVAEIAAAMHAVKLSLA